MFLAGSAGRCRWIRERVRREFYSKTKIITFNSVLGDFLKHDLRNLLYWTIILTSDSRASVNEFAGVLEFVQLPIELRELHRLSHSRFERSWLSATFNSPRANFSFSLMLLRNAPICPWVAGGAVGARVEAISQIYYVQSSRIVLLLRKLNWRFMWQFPSKW